MKSSNRKDTRKIELVETNNIALAIRRMSPHGWDNQSWKRALYHAAAMAEVANKDTLRRLRDALELP
jgi:uncharacterized protein YqiB (DUF1249 family)